MNIATPVKQAKVLIIEKERHYAGKDMEHLNMFGRGTFTKWINFIKDNRDKLIEQKVLEVVKIKATTKTLNSDERFKVQLI